MGVTLDGKTLTVMSWGEHTVDAASEWDAWVSGKFKRKLKVYGIIRTYVVDCVEKDVAWASSNANYFEGVQSAGTSVVFFSDLTIRPVSSVNVYVKDVNWTAKNIGTQNIRNFQLTLQEA
jgi:hypothetical protein